ncbi:MAG: hypothetical protein QM529_05115 [Hydrotalea sp.]|nr:hypothetical protein [Hydrotalea sp.]
MKKYIKNNFLTATAVLATVSLLATANTVLAQTTGTGTNGPLLANAVAGKLMLKADVGYVYSFAGDWSKTGGLNPGDNKSKSTGGVGYGASLGWTSKTGFGLSADYLGFNHKWTGLGTNDSTTQFNYDAAYHVVTFVPNYRFKLDSADNWGLRVGLGVGFSLSDVNWAQKITNGAQSGGLRVAGGAYYIDLSGNSGFPGYIPGGSSLCGGASNAFYVFDSVGGSISGINPDATSQCRTSIPSSKIIDVGDYAIATWLRGLGIGKSDIQNRASGNGTIIKTGVTLNYFTTIASQVINSCVWDGDGASPTTLGCYQSDGTQFVTAAAQAVCTSMGAFTYYTFAPGSLSGSCVLDQAQAAAAAKLAQDTADCLAKGAGYNYANGICNAPAQAADSGFDAGFVLAPQVALEYDNNLLHFDINVKYIHELLNVRYFGSEGSVDSTKSSGAIAYTSKAGPLALFIGAGIGINF